MKTLLVEHSGETQKIYRSLVVEPRKLNILGSELAVKIVSELSRQPQCAMDLSRKLKQHEQKIYYHLRNLERAGMVKKVGTESRYGMTAKIYDVVSPVVSAKLYEDGYSVSNPEPMKNPVVAEFLKPFIQNGKLNAKILIGDPYPHGKFDAGGMDACYASELALLLGIHINQFPVNSVRLDIHVTEEDLKENLIIIGCPKYNGISYKINQYLPIYFDEDEDWKIVSKITGKHYDNDLAGVVIKCNNPYNRNKKILVLAGRRTRGTQSAVMAVTKNLNELVKHADDTSTLAKVVRGVDANGDSVVDSIKILE